jgi:hypothetical protein
MLGRLREALYLQRLGGGQSARVPAALSPRERVAVAALDDLLKGLVGFGVALREGPGRAVAALPWIPVVR